MLGEEDSQNGPELRSRSKPVKILLSRPTLGTMSRGPSRTSVASAPTVKNTTLQHSLEIPQLDLSKGPLTTDVASLTQAVEPIPRVPRITRQVTRKSTQNRTRSPLRRASAPAAEMSPREVETPSSKRNIHDNVRTISTGNLDGGKSGRRERG